MFFYVVPYVIYDINNLDYLYFIYLCLSFTVSYSLTHAWYRPAWHFWPLCHNCKKLLLFFPRLHKQQRLQILTSNPFPGLHVIIEIIIIIKKSQLWAVWACTQKKHKKLHMQNLRKVSNYEILVQFTKSIEFSLNIKNRSILVDRVEGQTKWK